MKAIVRIHLLVSFLFLTLDSFSQNEARIWYFGNGLGLDFSTPTPSLLTNGSITTSVGCAAICSSTGGLLFYTDGVTIWNQTHAVMANGTGLFGNPGAQNCVIVKRPTSATQYFVFTVQGAGGSAGLCYSIVDMSLAAGNGSVIVKNTSVFGFPCEEKISATRHCNQIDAWVMVHEMNSQNFRAFQLTATGIATMVTSSFSPQPFPMTTISTHTGYSPRGTMKFSPNGRKFAEVFSVSNPTIPISNGGVLTAIFEIYDFDNSSGALSNIYTPTGISGNGNNSWAYGTEFSPDGSKLYFTYYGNLAQVHHCVYPSISNWSIPGLGDSPPSNQWRASLQLGPDGKIYVATVGSNSLGVINNPNNPGAACNYSPSAISLGTAVCGLGLPNYYTSYFEKTSQTFTAFSTPGPNCQTFNFFAPLPCPVLPNFTIPFTGYVISNYLWNFGDPLSGSANTSTLATPTHSFSLPGTYTVQLLVTYLCGRTDTIQRTLVVNPAPLISITSPSLSCGVTSATVSVSGAVGALSYTWQPSLGSSSVVSNLGAGIHTIYTYDAGTGCTYVSTFNTGTTVISATVNAGNLCPGVTSGTAGVLVLGGSGLYTYSWSGSTNTNSFTSGLAIGNHTVVVTDATNSCTLNNVFQLVQVPPLLLTILPNINGTMCTPNPLILSGNCVGGTPPYSYSWSNGPTTSSITISQSSAGNYSYVCNVLDSKNCPTSQSFTAVYFTTPTLAVTNSTICSGTTATLVGSGASSYIWLPGTSSVNPYMLSPTITTIYTLIGQTGPCGAVETLTVTVKTSPTLTLSSNAPRCAGQTITFNSSGANSYVWQGPQGFSSIFQNPSMVPQSSASSGVYTLTGTGSNSCSATSTLAIVVYSLPLVQISANSPLCVGQTLSLSVAPGSIFQWSGPGGFSSNQASPILLNISGNQAGTYSLSATSADSCKAFNSISVIVNPVPLVTVSGPTIICLGETATLIATGANSYLWNNGSNQSSIFVSPLTNSVYTATGTALGCSDQNQIKIKVTECTSIEEERSNLGVNCYPNPANTEVRLSSDEPVQVKLLDQTGAKIFEFDFLAGVHSISTEKLLPGVYNLQVLKAGGQTHTFKVVKVN